MGSTNWSLKTTAAQSREFWRRFKHHWRRAWVDSREDADRREARLQERLHNEDISHWDKGYMAPFPTMFGDTRRRRKTLFGYFMRCMDALLMLAASILVCLLWLAFWVHAKQIVDDMYRTRPAPVFETAPQPAAPTPGTFYAQGGESA